MTQQNPDIKLSINKFPTFYLDLHVSHILRQFFVVPAKAYISVII
jgi:hypothetical protein